jgi:hypothetical protein
MTTASLLPESAAGKLFFVTGLNGGREVFLGKALSDVEGERLTLEGKILSMTPSGRMVVRPFPTTMSLTTRDSGTELHHVSNPRACEEATSLLELSATHVNRGAAPFVFAWVVAALQCVDEHAPPSASKARPAASSSSSGSGPFLAFYETFQDAAEEFRRVLFQTRRVDSTRELDLAVELEGDLLIEVGKLTSRCAVKLNGLLQRERELAAYLEAIHPLDPPAHLRGPVSGWPFLFERLQAAKAWGRRNGRADLVRELNGLVKDGVFAWNEVILDHIGSLDALITETFGQYGIVHDIDVQTTPHERPHWGAEAAHRDTLHPVGPVV